MMYAVIEVNADAATIRTLDYVEIGDRRGYLIDKSRSMYDDLVVPDPLRSHRHTGTVARLPMIGR